MAVLRVLNSKNVQGVLVVAEAATATVTAAATGAFAAAADALNAAGEVATLETVLPGVLATLRAELGGNYNPRGLWTPDGVYAQNELVSFAVAPGVVGLFVASRDVPQGVLPTEGYYWTALGETAPSEPGVDPAGEPGPVETASLTLTLSEDAVRLSPGGSAVVQLEVALLYAAADTELIFTVESDEPGLAGLVARFEGAATYEDDAEFGDETAPEETANRALYTVTATATPETPVGVYTVRVVARAADWTDEPSSSRYGLRAEGGLGVTVEAAAAALQNPTAIYGMSGAAGYTLAEFAKDIGPNALHLIRQGNVRPNAQADGWRSDGGFGAALQTPPLTGHTMTGANEVGFIVAGSMGTAGKVVAALASTTQRNDWVCILKSAEGLRLRTSVQTPGGIATKDSAVVPHGDRLAISADPTSGEVVLHNVSAQVSASLPRPNWAAGGVIAVWLAVLRADGSIIAPDAGEVLAATTHAQVLDREARAQNMAALARDYTQRAFDPRPEFPVGTRLILPLLPGAVLTDRTFYDPATHDLRLLGDAAAGAEGGILTTGAAGSGARTDWLPDVTWGQSFTVGYLADGFFSLPPALCQLALASQNAAAAWLKIYPEIAGSDYRLVVQTPAAKVVATIGDRARHLFVFRYNASNRSLTVREVYSGKTTAAVSVPASFAGRVGVSLGSAYRGKTAAGTDLGATEPSATRSGGLWAGTGPLTAQEEEAMTLALGAASSAQPKAQAPPPPPPDPNPTPGGGTGPMIGVADWTPEVLGSGELRQVWSTYAQPGWLYLPNARRTNPVGVADGWDKTFEPTAANEGTVWRWDSYNGIRYRRYIGEFRGAYFLGRGMAQISETVVAQAFRATKDLRLLDDACLEFTALYDAARDESGIGTNQPDGYLGFAAGCDGKKRLFYGPNDPRNTAAVTVINGVRKPYYMNEGGGNEGLSGYTGLEIALEEGIMVFWMVTALGAHRNQDQFSPTYEPVGKRPATPGYYKAVRDKAIKLYLDTCNKWDDFFRARNDRKQELPLHVRRSLMHSWLCELGAKAAYAMILYGDAWEASPEGQEAARAWKMTFGLSEKVGVQPKVNLATWHEATHPKYGKCVFWVHDLRRTAPSATKDATGEYVALKTTPNGVHPNNYCGHDYGVMSFLHEEGASFVTREWLQKCANTVLATCDLGVTFARISTESSPTPIPYRMHGNEYVPSLSSPWGDGKSNTGASDSFLVNSAAPSLCAYDTHGELEPLVKRHQARYGSPQDYGATSGLLLAAAKREGRL